MRIDISHSGSVEKDDRFSISLVEVAYPTVGVSDGHANLRFVASEAELKNIIIRAFYALEDARLFNAHHAGKLTAEEYDAAIRKMDLEGPPILPCSALLPTERQVKP